MTLQASIGVSPWSVLNTGLAYKLNTTYGNVSLALSALILIADIWMGERIGVGTVLDAVVCGKLIDFYTWTSVVPKADNVWLGTCVLLAGMSLMSVGQWLHMGSAIGCGPRDSLWVALCKRMPKIPIGVVNDGILLIVFLTGWALGGDAGIGTVISVILTGPITQGIFAIVRFEPRTIKHESFRETFWNVKGVKR